MRAEGPIDHAWNFSEEFGADARKNWGLWNFDVVEAFLQLRQEEQQTEGPYLEVQLSPEDQAFALVILRPRQSYYTPLELVFTHHSWNAPGLWEAWMEVELPPELGEGELYGGLFACLGQSERSFYALHPNTEVAPDFHRPELFVAL